MTRKGVYMVCLALSASGMAVGCSSSAALPPSASPAQVPPPVVTMPAPIPEVTSRPIVGELNPTPSLEPEVVFNEWAPDVPEREWEFVVLHHTASSGGSVESIHEAHLKKKDKSGNPWLGIGYHFVIGNGNGMGDGEIQPTFRWREQMHGAHAGSNDYNQRGIGICLVGNFEDQHPSDAQLQAVERLVATMKKEYGISSERVVGHAEVKATACPGKHFPLEAIRESSLVDSNSGNVPLVRMVRLQETQLR